MKKRVLPTPDKFASCPNEGKVLGYFEGQYESVYVLLSPFMRPTSIPMVRFCPEKWPTKQELINGTEAVTWEQILSLTRLKSIDEIDIGLRTSIGGLNAKFSKQDFSEILCELTETAKIIHPPEGDVSPLLENRLYDSLQHLGHEWVWVGDEFCTKRKLTWIDDLKKGDEIPCHGCVFTPDKSIMITSHWDSHFSFLCSSKSTILQILDHQDFEGFFCTPETEVYWSVAGTGSGLSAKPR
jgi:hypothetical protein